MGVTGGSGGGLLTNWIVGHTHRFAAAITQRCVSDWAGMFYSCDFAMFQPFWFRGAPWEHAMDFEQQSPARLLPAIETPLMVIHSEEEAHRDDPLPGREPRTLPFGRPVPSRPEPTAHPPLVRPLAHGEGGAGIWSGEAEGESRSFLRRFNENEPDRERRHRAWRAPRSAWPPHRRALPSAHLPDPIVRCPAGLGIRFA
jgi:hypothetical protein